MKGRNLILTGLIAALIGLVLILFRTSLADGGVVLAGGIIFVLAGVLNMSVFLASRDKEGNARMGAFGTAFGWIASAAAVVLGLAMLIFSKAFVAIVGFMFAVLLLCAALFQIFLITFGARPSKLSGLFYLLPGALIGSALFVFLHKPDTPGEQIIMLVTGISFMVFGLVTVIEGSVIGHTNHRTLKAARTAETATSEPARIEEHKEEIKDNNIEE